MPKISEYTEDTAPAGNDLIPFVDVSAGTTEKVQVGNLAASDPFTSRFPVRPGADGVAGEVLAIASLAPLVTEWIANGDVISVNGAAGDVVLDAQDVGALKSDSGAGDRIYSLTNVTGATTLALASGNYQVIQSTAGNYTLSVTGMLTGLAATFTLFITPTTTGHTPTWFANISWAGGVPNITWTSAVLQIFQFSSIDGVNWRGWHLTTSPPVQSKEFSWSGTLAVATGTHRIYNDSGEARTITTVRASVGTAPTGASLYIDVNINGTTIFGTQSDRPTLTHSPAINTDTATPTGGSATWAAGDYLTVDIDPTASGADLTVSIFYRQGS